MEKIQEVLDLLQMIFDTIKKYFFIVLGREDEIEGDVPTDK